MVFACKEALEGGSWPAERAACLRRPRARTPAALPFSWVHARQRANGGHPAARRGRCGPRICRRNHQTKGPPQGGRWSRVQTFPGRAVVVPVRTGRPKRISKPARSATGSRRLRRMITAIPLPASTSKAAKMFPVQ